MPRRRFGAKVRLNLEVAESVRDRVLLLQELTNADSMTEVSFGSTRRGPSGRRPSSEGRGRLASSS